MDKALDRIEEAIRRIERAANSSAESDASLRTRHEKLKASVSQTLGKLDELIAGQRQ